MTSFNGKAVTLIELLACVVVQVKKNPLLPSIGFNVNTFFPQSSYIKVQRIVECSHEIENEFGSILNLSWLSFSKRINLTS
ncbi:MAG: hypothetical protein ACTS47_00450, partial [Candidatus Hodgkinia cicadicola]